MATDRRVEARQRLDAALIEQDRLGDRYRRAIGSSSELSAYARLRAASDDVACQDARFRATDSETSGGRMWINGVEVGGEGSRFRALEEPHD